MSEESKRIFAEVKAAIVENNARLNGQPHVHKFAREEPKLFAKWKCEICGGRVDAGAAMWYETGLKHAKL